MPLEAETVDYPPLPNTQAYYFEMAGQETVNDLPEYALRPLRRFFTHWDESSRLLHASMNGISSMRGMPRVIELLAETAPEHEKAQHDPEKHRLSLERAQSIAAFAEKEIEAGFPLLHAHALVGVWGALEASIEDLLVGILTYEPEILRTEAFRKLKVSLADFESLDKEERMRLVVEDLSHSHGMNGVDAIEALLNRFALSGKVEEDTKKDLWEANHIRNVIVHRGSLADRRLVESCPWIGLKTGDLVIVTHEDLFRYGNAIVAYVMTLIYRLAVRYSVDIEAKIARVTADREKPPELRIYQKWLQESRDSNGGP